MGEHYRWQPARSQRALLSLREIAPTGQAMGARLVARGKNRIFDEQSSPLASGLVPLAQTVATTAEAFMKK